MAAQDRGEIPDDIPRDQLTGPLRRGIGVVGPVRTGKSTFIKKFMDTMVIPKINNTYTKHDTEVLISNSANILTGDINTVDSKLNDYLLVGDFNTFKTSNTTSTNNLSARINDNKNRF